jgi:hypothetical protein
MAKGKDVVSNKPWPEFVADLLYKNYADVFAVICSVLIIGYVWGPTSKVCSQFVVLQHNVTDGVDGMETARLCAFTM